MSVPLQGLVQYTTNPATLEIIGLMRAEVPVQFHNCDVVYDLEVEFHVQSASRNLLSAMLCAVVELRTAAGDLVDLSKLTLVRQSENETVLKATLMRKGFPMVGFRFVSSVVSIAVVLPSTELAPYGLVARVEWHGAFLSLEQRQDLAQSCIAIECPPLKEGAQSNVMLFWQGMGSPHFSGGPLEFLNTRLPSSALLCARELQVHLSNTAGRDTLPHTLSCADCKEAVLLRLAKLFKDELALTAEELAIVLGDPGQQ